MENSKKATTTDDLEFYEATHRMIQAAVWLDHEQIQPAMKKLKNAVFNYDLRVSDPDDPNETIAVLLERRAAIKAAAEELLKLF